MSKIFEINDRIINKNPTPQTALDIFSGTWISKLPAGFEYNAGQTPLFEDTRIQDGVNVLGSIEGKTILDLGPLEGGQAYILEKLGAKSIISVEVNVLFYLKSLIIKEILGMNRVHFLCGDAVEYLKNTTEYFDLGLACGILYHMMNPIELLWLLSQTTEQLLIWTHYFDENNLPKNNITKFRDREEYRFNGVSYSYYLQEYGSVFKESIYCGGTVQSSNWIPKNDILLALKEFGYSYIKVIHESDSLNGPLMLIGASKHEIS